MHLPAVQHRARLGPYGRAIERLEAAGTEVPEILYPFAFKPEVGRHLENLTHAVMRGPSPLSPGMRELIAAWTSARNRCPF